MAKKRYRKAYDLPPEITQKLDELSEELGIPQGHLIALFTMEGIERLEKGELSLDEYLEPHLNSLKYRWRLDLTDKIRNFIKKKKD